MQQFSELTPGSNKRNLPTARSSDMKENLYAPIKSFFKEKQIEDNTSSKSTQSGNSSPHLKLECEENLEDINLNPKSSFEQLQIFQNAKSSASFVQEIYGQPPPEYEPLEVEEYEFASVTL